MIKKVILIFLSCLMLLGLTPINPDRRLFIWWSSEISNQNKLIIKKLDKTIKKNCLFKGKGTPIVLIQFEENILPVTTVFRGQGDLSKKESILEFERCIKSYVNYVSLREMKQPILLRLDTRYWTAQ